METAKKISQDLAEENKEIEWREERAKRPFQQEAGVFSDQVLKERKRRRKSEGRRRERKR